MSRSLRSEVHSKVNELNCGIFIITELCFSRTSVEYLQKLTLGASDEDGDSDFMVDNDAGHEEEEDSRRRRRR